MLNVHDHQTGDIFDPWSFLGPKRRKLLEASWAGIFRHYLLNKLPVEKLIPYFDATKGRPSKELYQVLGGLILQQVQDLTDEETQWHMCFDQGWHYALDIISQSDEDSYVCERTLFAYRQIMLAENLDGLLFETLTDTLIDAFNVDTSKQRLDSTHIQSNMRKLGRLKIFAETIKKFLNNLKRHYPKLYKAKISSDIHTQYLSKKGYGCFSQVKPTEARRVLDDLSKEMLQLVGLFKANPAVKRLNSYQLMERVLQEQCIIIESDDNGPQITLKAPSDIPSDSLQNPSDPDAAYSHHKGQGYSAQIMETYTPDDEKQKDKDPPLDLITYVEVTPANIGDSNALLPALDSTEERKCKPSDLSADTSYGGDENVEQAKDREVTMVAPTHCSDGQGDTLGLKDFEIDSEQGTLCACPQGHPALETHRTRTDRNATTFDHSTCIACPDKDSCPIIIQKTQAVIYYDDKQIRLAQRRRYEQTEEFKDRYRWRAGIEGTNARLKQQTGAARLRVSGLAKVRFSIKLKVLGINIFRAAKVHARKVYKAFENARSACIFIYFRTLVWKVNNVTKNHSYGLSRNMLSVA